MRKQYPSVISLALLVIVGTPSCASDKGLENSGTPSNTDPETDIIDNNSDLAINITDALFSNRSGDCTTYANVYFSNVSNTQNGTSYKGELQISVSGGKCIFTTNAIPNHNFGDGGDFAHEVAAQNVRYEITASPTKTATATVAIWGDNGVFLNGVKVDLLAAACYDEGIGGLGQEKIGCGPDQIEHPWRYEAMSPQNNFGTDKNNAHTQPNGAYHYHGNPMAMFETDCSKVSSASPVIGFAADGFPIFGSCFSDNGSIRNAQSSYRLKDNGGPRQAVPGYSTPIAGTGYIASANYDGQFRGDYEYLAGSGDLDACNGMAIDGQYGYYITNTYPWILACFTGTPDPSF